MGYHVGRHWPAIYEQRGSKVGDLWRCGCGEEWKRASDLPVECGRCGSHTGIKTLEDECPCPVEPCGLIDHDKIDPECPQHAMTAAKTFRASHPAEDCPGARGS